MKMLSVNNEKFLNEARLERDKIIKEARELKDQIVTQAKEEAMNEVNKIKKAAEIEIEAKKAGAVEDMKNQVLELSVAVAEKILMRELETKNEQENLIVKLLKEVQLN
jgi:F-type H+-transporting ATPase subunit b